VGLPEHNQKSAPVLFIITFDSFHTVSSTLWHWSLAASTANADTVDNIALLGLVSESACLVGARRTRSTMDDVKLSEPNKLMYFSANVQRSVIGTIAASGDVCRALDL
jgi:hypothetical protein